MNDSDKLAELKLAIENIKSITNEAWIGSLDDRKIKELEFHNRDRDPEFVETAATDSDTFEKFYGNKKFYRTVQRSTEYVDDWIKVNAKGKVFLDFACGNGEHAIKASESGAELALGLDISDVSINNAEQEATKRKLENILFFQADCEDTKLPDDSVDVIICSGMLHHLDLSYVFPELRRILKDKGKILAIEALDYNPFIKLYRLITPDMRTEWEKAHILSFADLKFAERFFDVKNVKYWHVVSYAGAYLEKLLPFLNFMDSIMERIPLLRVMSWIFTFELHSNK